MDRLDSMTVFRRVAELGSFSAVARQMDVARSVVTRQVAALEAHLGVKLIARSTRQLSLTSAGIAYLEKCREILNLVEAAESDVVQERQVPRGHIRISVPLSFGLRHLTPLLLDFGAAYPDVSLEVDYTDRKVNLIEEGADLAIRITGRLGPQEVARRISVSRMIVVAAPEYLEKHGEPQHPAELIGHECFGYTPIDRFSWNFLIDGQVTAFPVRNRLCANNGDALLDAAERGMGLTNPPTFIAASAIEAGLVKPVDFLIERIGPDPYWDSVALFGGRKRPVGGKQVKK